MFEHLGKTWRLANQYLSITALFVIATIALMVAVDFQGRGLFWINLYWICCAALAFYFSLLALPRRRRLLRLVRLALALSMGCAFAGQIVWAAQVWAGWSIVPGPSDILFLFVPIPALWAALFAIRYRVSEAVRTTALLDAISTTLAIIIVILAIFASRLVNFGFVEAAILVLYPTLYLSPVGAFLVTSLAVREEPRFAGNWLIMLGALISGLSFSIWTSAALDGNQPVGTVTDYCFGVGIIMISLGAASIDQITATGLVKRRLLTLMSELLPLIAIVVAVLTAFVEDVPERMEPLIWTAVLALLLVNGIRQILLIRSQRQTQSSLRILSAELSNTEESERRKIATYLHDKVGQSIAVMSLKFGQIREESDDPKRAQLLDDVDSLLSDAADNVRSSTFEISPPVLYELGLVPALNSLAAILEKKFSLCVEVVDNCESQSELGTELPLLYRFTRELLLNVVKHAKAKSATVTLDQDRANIYIIVKDDGIGFDTKNHPISELDGFGLTSIKERVRAIGGRFTIRSAPNEGTIATIVLPAES